MLRSKRLIGACLTASAAALVGCASKPDPNAVAFQKVLGLCRQNVPYPDFGACIERGLAVEAKDWRSDPHVDLVDVYIAWNKAAGQYVASGRVSEAEARYAEAEMLARLRDQAQQRDNRAAADRAMRADQAFKMLAGFAMYTEAMNSYSSPPRFPITCTTFGNRTTCQ